MNPGTIEIVEGDLLDQDVEVIVNSWQARLDSIKNKPRL